MVRRVAAWLGRAVLAAAAVLFLAAGPPRSLGEDPLGAGVYVIGAMFAAGVLVTFRVTRTVGTVLLGVGLWTVFTGYGVVAFVDPAAVAADSQRSHRGPHVDTDLGARVLGAFVLALANLPLALWLWSLVPARHRPEPNVGPPGPVREDPAHERRQRSRRRRKRRLERR